MLGARGLREGGELRESAAADAWAIFKEFAEIPVEGMSSEDESDGLLFQTGVYDWHDGQGRNFNFSLVRQFSFNDDDGEYDHMEQLEVLLLFQPTRELESLPRDEMWSFGKSLGEYFVEAEARPSFQGVISSGVAPTQLQIRLDEV